MIPVNDLKRGFAAYQAEFEQKALDVLRSGWYVLGKEVTAFEEEFAAQSTPLAWTTASMLLCWVSAHWISARGTR